MNSACSWDITVSIITVIATIVFLIVIRMSFIKFMLYRKKKKILPALFALLIAIISSGTVFLAAVHFPINISIDNNCLYVNQLKGAISIPVETVKEIRMCNASDTKNSIRTFGSGGFFGYLGIFKNSNLGKYKMYVTNSSNKVLVKTNDETYIFSCDKPVEIIDYVKNSLSF